MIQTDDEIDRTLWCGNIHDKVTEELLYELFLQAGPLEKVKVVDDKHHGPKYAFITFKHSVSVPYTMQLMNGIRLYDQPLRLKQRGTSTLVNTAQLSQPVLPQPMMGSPAMIPPPVRAHAPLPMGMPRASSTVFSQNIPAGHVGLMRSYSEPHVQDSGRHESRRNGGMANASERSAGPYSQLFRRHAQETARHGVLAPNIASQVYRFNQAVPRQMPPFDARNSYYTPHRQQHYSAHAGFHR